MHRQPRSHPMHPPGLQLPRICTQDIIHIINIYYSVLSGCSGFPIGAADAASGAVLGSVQSTRLLNTSSFLWTPQIRRHFCPPFFLSFPVPVFRCFILFPHPHAATNLQHPTQCCTKSQGPMRSYSKPPTVVHGCKSFFPMHGYIERELEFLHKM